MFSEKRSPQDILRLFGINLVGLIDTYKNFVKKKNFNLILFSYFFGESYSETAVEVMTSTYKSYFDFCNLAFQRKRSLVMKYSKERFLSSQIKKSIWVFDKKIMLSLKSDSFNFFDTNRHKDIFQLNRFLTLSFADYIVLLIFFLKLTSLN